MKKRVIIKILFFSLFLTSCSMNKYNVKIDNGFKALLTKDFLEENKVRSAFYKGENNEYYMLEEGPEEILFVVDSKELLDEITLNFYEEIDFESKVMLVYIFSNYYPGRNFNFLSANLNKQILTINIKIEKGRFGAADASMPYQRVLMFILEKQDNVSYEVKIR